MLKKLLELLRPWRLRAERDHFRTEARYFRQQTLDLAADRDELLDRLQHVLRVRPVVRHPPDSLPLD